MILVELCAGSAAVSLRWLSGRAVPPIAYQGGKRAYADAILAALGLAPGSGRGQEVVLVEPGPWGQAWQLWRTPAGRADTIDRLMAWDEMDPRELWETLRSSPVPQRLEERVAAWAVLQYWSFARKPVYPSDGSWKHHGFNFTEAYARQASIENRDRWKANRGVIQRDRRLSDVIEGLVGLPDMGMVRVVDSLAHEVMPIHGAVCYLDPDYAGTTCEYGFSIKRDDVLAVAKTWQAAGARTVAISESVGLDLPGWSHVDLGNPNGRGRNWSKQRGEFLTMSHAPFGQTSLF